MDALTKLWDEVDGHGLQPGGSMTLLDGRMVEMLESGDLRVVKTIVRRRAWELPVMTGTRAQCAAWVRAQEVGTVEEREARAREIETTGPPGVMAWDASVLTRPEPPASSPPSV